MHLPRLTCWPEKRTVRRRSPQRKIPCGAAARLVRLDNVELDTMKGLTDLSPIAATPALRRLSVTSMPQLKTESFGCFIGHPRLEEFSAYTGRSRVNEQVKRMFPFIAK
jgi:hypothetical protein